VLSAYFLAAGKVVHVQLIVLLLFHSHDLLPFTKGNVILHLHCFGLLGFFDFNRI
jgi:hypothetical protein